MSFAAAAIENEQLQDAIDDAVPIVLDQMGQTHPLGIGGDLREARETFEAHSPMDSELLVGRFPLGRQEDVAAAVAESRGTANSWARLSWQERVAIGREVSRQVRLAVGELAALVAVESGKTRLEAVGDVEELADIMDFHCEQVEAADGFAVLMGQDSPQYTTRDVLRPYGTLAMLGPANYSMGCQGTPMTAALVTGNSVIYKPSSHNSLSALRMRELLLTAGVPAAAFQVVTGAGPSVGAALVADPGIDGVLLNGSAGTGRQIINSIDTPYAKPLIFEMGGKNPVIVMPSADLELATEGICRAAFGFAGQKCSAAARLYVAETVADDLLSMLRARMPDFAVGHPLDRASTLCATIRPRNLEIFERAVAEAHAQSGEDVGGQRLLSGELANGRFVSPALAEVAPDSWIWRSEFLAPFLAVRRVADIAQGVAMANDSPFGMTAGLYSQSEDDIDFYLANIEAGVANVNRRAGATTGGWPGLQPFGGWKASGNTGRFAGGARYITQFMHEQSQTLVRH